MPRDDEKIDKMVLKLDHAISFAGKNAIGKECSEKNCATPPQAIKIQNFAKCPVYESKCLESLRYSIIRTRV